MPRPVIAIGLDSAEPNAVEKWLDDGALPTLARLARAGSYRRLRNFDAYSAETPWTTFLTGCSPEKTGYWSPLGLVEGTYRVETLAAYDFDEFPPFYALGDAYRVAAFDVPQVRLSERINGPQVAAWGAHSPQVAMGSLPESLYAEIVEKYGTHPGLHKDYAECLNLELTREVAQRLETGAARRGDICADLIARERWDLFLTVFGEAHGGGHNLWHLSQPDHPLYEPLRDRWRGDPLLELFQTMDRSVEKILSSGADDANVVVFSAHGMGPNTMDMPSMAFLPELMYRLSFPGERFLPGGDTDQPPPPILLECAKNSWIKHVWAETASGGSLRPLRRALRRNLPWRYYRHLAPLLDRPGPLTPSNPYQLRRRSNIVPWQPAQWMAHLWPQMKAFALPSFAEGYVRVNLRGREPNGIVAPEDYDAFLGELEQKIRGLRDARHGIPMARRVFRTRSGPDDRSPKAPDADLVVVWQEEFAADVVDSPDVGRMGPLPHYRSGSHRSTGFLIAAGPDVPQLGERGPEGHALDLAPTVLSLMGAQIPAHCEGTPLL